MRREKIYVGVARLAVVVSGARTLKDRRQVLSSIEDRLRHRFEVTVHAVGATEDPQLEVLVVTTAGNDGRQVRSVLDQCCRFVREHPVASASEVDVDVFRWHPSEGSWADRRMAEFGGGEEEADEEGG